MVAVGLMSLRRQNRLRTPTYLKFIGPHIPYSDLPTIMCWFMDYIYYMIFQARCQEVSVLFFCIVDW